MKRLLLVLWMASACTAFAQQAQLEAARSEIAKLSMLVGEWRGSGWMMLRGGKHTFTSEEKAELRLDGHALVIEGLHRDPGGKVVHQAIGVLGWDAKRGEYRFGTALASGATGHHPGRIEDGRFIWTLAGAGPQRRFVIPLGDRDTWEEYGEVSTDGGKTWRRFFEMRLQRVR